MDDLLELDELRALAPSPPVRPLSPERLAARKETLMREVARTLDAEATPPGQAPAPRPTRRLRKIAAFVLVPAALLGGAIAYSTNANRSPEQLGNEITCFQAPSLSAPAAGGGYDGRTLAAYCEFQWNSGSLIAPPPGPAPTQWVACESDTDGVDVFPGTDQNLCGRLGLQPLPPGYFEAVQRFSAMESDLDSHFPENGCPSDRDATEITRRVLDAHGYSAWTITSGGFGEQTPCAQTPDVDPVNGTATITGGVRPELLAAVQNGLEAANDCGPEPTLLADVQQALAQAGFSDWTVRLDHQLTEQWPCVVGFNEDPVSKTITIMGHASHL